MSETRTLHDPFLDQDVEISNRLVDRLRGKYANGATMPNGEPEFGWREFPVPPIQKEAADVIERLREQPQLVARIKRGCKYWGQTAPNAWFDVRVVADRHYQLRGNNNNYRLSDVVMGVRLGDTIMDLKTGKASK